MTHQEFEWKSQADEKIFAQSWQATETKAVICLVHGMGEHSTRYDHVAQYFGKKGFSTFTYDHPGHGKSEGARGHVASYEALLAEVDVLIGKAKAAHPDLPIFLYGHSMGGNVVINYCLRKQSSIKAAVVTGPWLKLAFDPPTVKLALGKMMNKLYPKYTESSNLNADHISHVAEEVKAYVEDPLVHDKISTRFFLGTHQAAEWAMANADKLTIPILINHGGDDQITSAPASKEFAQKAGALARYKEWDGLYHEIHHEANRTEVLSYISSWMEDVLNA